MPLAALLHGFESLKKSRAPARRKLTKIGLFGKEAHGLLIEAADRHPIAWHGSGEKTYSVHTPRGTIARWSRATSDSLFIVDHEEYSEGWSAFEEAVIASAGECALGSFEADYANRVIYTAVMSWAVCVDLFQPSNGLAGRFLEMVVGSTVAILSGRPESGHVVIEVGGGEKPESVKVDLTFHSETQSLAVPTKISTRERISQPYVHARILEKAFPRRYRTALCVGNETNAFHVKGTPNAQRTVKTLYLGETLVPGTIALYQKYIAHLDGIYYLDPPWRYVHDTPPGFPKVATVGQMLAEDLTALLTDPTENSGS